MTTPTFSSGWDFLMGLGKPHQPSNFEVAIVSRCRNIKGEPQILGSSRSPVFPLGVTNLLAVAIHLILFNLHKIWYVDF